MTYSELKKDYESKQKAWKDKIKAKPTKWQRFWGWVWYLLAFAWVWLFYNIRDWRSAVIFGIVLVVYSGSVWGFYVAGLLCGWTSTETGKWLIGIGSSVWAWWLSPAGSPFILLCTITTIGIKAIFDKIKTKKLRKRCDYDSAMKCPYKIECEENSNND